MNLFTYMGDLLFPPKCIFCGKLLSPGARPLICDRCSEDIPLPKNKCAKCGGDLNYYENRPICTTCRTAGRHFDGCLSSAIYAGDMRNAIHEYKFKYRMYMSKPLVYSLARRLKQIGISRCNIDYITAVPGDASRIRERGFDCAGLLAKDLAEMLDIPYNPKILQKIKITQSQRGLSATERAKNVRGAYRVTSADLVKGKSILLVDDVFTTGATATEVSRVLKRCKASYVFVATVAAHNTEEFFN